MQAREGRREGKGGEERVGGGGRGRRMGVCYESICALIVSFMFRLLRKAHCSHGTLVKKCFVSARK